MMNDMPKGLYAVSAGFAGQTGEVAFTFQGAGFTGQMGETAFATLEEAAKAAVSVPEAPFMGRSYDTPVLLMPAGVYSFGRALQTPLPRGLTLLGEGAGISPNRPGNIREANPARPAEETVLEGSFYYGTIVMPAGAEGRLTLDGLTLHDARVYDARTGGEGLGLALQNCVFTGALTATLVRTAALAAGSRQVRLSDCRLDGFDALDAEGGLIFASASEITLERVYFAHTTKFLGLTDYGWTLPSGPAGGAVSVTLRDCLFEACETVHGLTVALPAEAAPACVSIEGCAFRQFVPEGEPAVTVRLPHKECSLRLKDVEFTGRKRQRAPAILVDGCREAKVELADVRVADFDGTLDNKPARRRQAPDCVGEALWAKDRLDDPHELAAEGDFAQLEALYSGRYAFHGDMHTHTDSGGTSDGATPLAEFVQQLEALDLDFAAVVDHRQMRHMFLPEWDDTRLIYGTEPGTVIVEEGRAPRSSQMHYVMLFQYPTDLARVMAAFPEFAYTGGLEGHFSYPTFTPERLAELARFVRGLGGAFSHAHPKQLMASDNPLDFYFTDAVMLETINADANSYGTAQNLKLWDTVLRMGKRVHTVGCSDTHGAATNRALTTVYARERKGAAYLREIREGDCAAGAVGMKMAIAGTRMGGSLPYRDGLTLAIELNDFFKPAILQDTVYALKVYTDRGLACATEFSGRTPQRLAVAVKRRSYYRAEVTNESDGVIVGISNPIWLD